MSIHPSIDDWLLQELPKGYGLQTAGRLLERDFSQRQDAWTPEQTALLQSLFRDDIPLAEIASMLGRSLHGTRSKICDLGLRRNSARPWTEEEDSILLKFYRRESTSQLAVSIGRSPASIYAKASQLGLTLESMPPWDEFEIESLKRYYRDGEPISQIAAALGRTISAVNTKASDLGLRHHNHDPRWSSEEVAILAECVDRHLTAREISEELKGRGFDRSRSAVKQMVNKLGFERPTFALWTPEEDARLREGVSNGERLASIALSLNRTLSGARWRSRHLGLKHPKPDGNRGGPLYTSEELRYLTESYGKAPVKEIAAKLGRPLRSVYCQAFHMGLKTGNNQRFSEAEDALLLSTLAKDGPKLIEVARQIGRNYQVVSKRRKRLTAAQG